MLRSFLSATTNKIDAKGRVSVPAKFRAIIADAPVQCFYGFASLVNPAVEAYTPAGMDAFSQRINAFDKYSPQRQAFEFALLSGAHELSLDPEGRIVLSELLIAHSKLTTHATFVGVGANFEIWEPRAYEARLAAAREEALRNIALLAGSWSTLGPTSGSGGGGAS